MRRIKRPVAGFLAIVMVLSLLCSSAAAASAEAEPTLRAETPEAFYQLLSDRMVARDTDFTVEYAGEISEVYAGGREGLDQLLEDVYAAGLGRDDSAGDYLRFTMSHISLRTESSLGGESRFRFTIRYLTTAQEELWVEQRVNEILAELQLDQMTNLQKVRTVYQYVCTHFTYDYSLENFSAYSGLSTGKMVCQGYTLLTYKLLARAGVPVRIVAGVSHNEPHGWNIVELNGLWYNLDTTWDSMDSSGNTMTWNYFLKNQADFPDHSRDAMYDTAEFHSTYAMARDSMDLRPLSLHADDDGLITSLMIRKGLTLQLSAIWGDQAHPNVTWSSTNPEAVSVTPDGLVTSLAPGQAMIIATSSDARYLSVSLPVTAVDLTAAAPWAQEDITTLYFRKVIPGTILLESFQGDITRAEYATLLCNLCLMAAPNLASKILGAQVPEFTDIEGHRYYAEIYTAALLGITDGTSATTFSPDAPLTREQAAKMLCSALEVLEAEVIYPDDAPGFADSAAISHWALPYVAAAEDLGILKGDGVNFHPQTALNRQEGMVTVERCHPQHGQAA